MSTIVNGPRVKQSPVFKAQVPGLDAGDNRKDTSSTPATSASTSRLKNSNEKGAEPVNYSITLNNKGKSIASSSHVVVRVIFHCCPVIAY
jgi:hypothetical protein